MSDEGVNNLTVSYALENIEDVLGEIRPLLEAHWLEIARYPDIRLNPNWDQYWAFEAVGALRIYTARCDRRLVGYAIYVVAPALHYQHSIQANQDILFLLPEFRGGAGRNLIRFSEEALRAQGVQVIYQHVKATHNFGPMLERQGYELVDLIYGKRLT